MWKTNAKRNRLAHSKQASLIAPRQSFESASMPLLVPSPDQPSHKSGSSLTPVMRESPPVDTRKDYFSRLVEHRVSLLYRRELRKEKTISLLATPLLVPRKKVQTLTPKAELKPYPARFKSKEAIDSHLSLQRNRGFKAPESVKDDLKMLKRLQKDAYILAKYVTNYKGTRF